MDFLYIFTAVASVAFCSFIMYTSSDSPSVRFTLGIILTSALVLPLIDTVSSLDDISFSDISENEYSSNLAQSTVTDAFCRGIALSVLDKFSLKSSDIKVSCEGLDMQTMKASVITVTLSGKAVYADSRGIKEYITESVLSECEVIFNFE